MRTKSQLSNPLRGSTNTVPDKSISHRAVILSSLAQGKSSIYNLLLSEDIKSTLEWAKIIGVEYKYNNKLEIDTKLVKINNKSIKKNSHETFYEDVYKFFLNNSGTSARLLMGVMSGFNSISLFYGDDSLQKRPMLRVLKPLSMMGAEIHALTDLSKQNFILNDIKSYDNTKSLINVSTNYLKGITKYETDETFLPTVIKGGKLRGINFTLEVASAQVKSAILLASLFAEGETLITEPVLTRDHTENMLKAAGINLKIGKNDLGSKTILMPNNKTKLNPCNWNIPGDFSSAAFIIVASLIVPKSNVLIKGINLNPLRTGLLKVLENIGANIKICYKGKLCGEDYGDIEVNYTQNLKPIIVKKDMVASMIDEFPILFILASMINGESKFLGIEELRYKESDRIQLMENILNSLGIDTKSTLDSLTIYGNTKIIENALHIVVNPNLDHRIAMSCLVLGLVMKNGITVESTETINSSFPGFTNIFQALNANVRNHI